MKNTGIVRKIDMLGRIVLPKELRNTLDIKEGDSLGIYTGDGSIILHKYQPGCIICGEITSIINFKGKNVCEQCISDIASK